MKNHKLYNSYRKTLTVSFHLCHFQRRTKLQNDIRITTSFRIARQFRQRSEHLLSPRKPALSIRYSGGNAMRTKVRSLVTFSRTGEKVTTPPRAGDIISFLAFSKRVSSMPNNHRGCRKENFAAASVVISVNPSVRADTSAGSGGRIRPLHE